MSEYGIAGVSFLFIILSLLFLNIVFRVMDLKKIKKILKNENILSGVLASIAVILLFVLSAIFFAKQSQAGEWSYINYIEIQAGITYTKNVSLSCQQASEFNKGTSDIRASLNLFSYETSDGLILIDVNSSILHHSCAFGEDTKSFDSFTPAEATFRLNF